jgi:hypothetical protein
MTLRGRVSSRSEVAGLLVNPGDAVIVDRGVPRWLLMRCPCGCGEDIPVNLDVRAGKAWRIYEDAKTGVSVYPSVWRDTGCESHFVIRRNQIYMFSHGDDEYQSSYDKAEMSKLAQKVISRWPATGFVRFPEAADALGELPWDVLDACRLLAKTGALVEGVGQMRGFFRRPG